VDGAILDAADFRKFLKCLALIVIEPSGNFNLDAREDIAACGALESGHTLTADAKHRAALRAGGDFEVHGAFECRHTDFATESRRGEREWDFAEQIQTFAGEDIVLFNVNHDVEIARWPAANARLAAACAPQTRRLVDAGGDFDFDAGCFFVSPLAAAGFARLLDDLSAPVALGAGLGNLEKSP